MRERARRGAPGLRGVAELGRAAASTASTSARSPRSSTRSSSRGSPPTRSRSHDRLPPHRPPFYIMKSNGGVIAGHRGPPQADHDDPLRPGGGHARRGAGRRAGRLPTRDHARRRRHVDRRGGDQRRPAEPDHRGVGRPLRGQGADGRRDHGRHRRRLDRLGLARGDAEGRAALGRARAPGPACYPDGGAEPTTTDAFLLLGHIPEHLLGGEIPLRRAAAEAVYERLAEAVGMERGGVRGRRARDRRLEPGERDPPGDRQARPGRARLRPVRVRRLGPADRVPADRHPRAARRVRAARPRQPERVRAAGHRPALRPRADARAPPRPARRRRAGARVRAARGRRDRATSSARATAARALRAADLRYFGQAFEIQVPAPDGAIDDGVRRGGRGALPRRARALLRLLLPRRPAPGRRVGEPARHRRRRDGAAGAEPAARRRPAHPLRTATRPRVLRRSPARDAGLRARAARRRRRDQRPGGDRGVRLDAPDPPGVHGARRRARQRAWCAAS